MIGHIRKGAFHRWLGKKPGAAITEADIARGLKAGGHAAKMAQFAKAARGFRHAHKALHESHQREERKKVVHPRHEKASKVYQ